MIMAGKKIATIVVSAFIILGVIPTALYINENINKNDSTNLVEQENTQNNLNSETDYQDNENDKDNNR